MSPPLSGSARKVLDALSRSGFIPEIMELPASTRTAQEAAQAVGCAVGQIAKSIVFRAERSGRAVLVVTSGANRVNEARLAETLGEPIGRADPEFVRARTGFGIGGVPPAGHAEPLTIFLDQDLMQHAEIWAAAGTPHAVFRLSPAQLLEITGGTVVSVK